MYVMEKNVMNTFLAVRGSFPVRETDLRSQYGKLRSDDDPVEKEERYWGKGSRMLVRRR